MYQFYYPAPRLRPFIENYWMLRTDATQQIPVQEAIFVDGKADILFNFGVAYDRANMSNTIDHITHSNLDAQRSYPVAILQTGAIYLIGVRFKLVGISPFLAIPMSELSDQVISLDDAFGGAANELEARLYDAAADPLRQIALLDAFFLKRLLIHEQHRLVLAVTQYMVNQPNLPSIDAISNMFGYSIRSLDRFFQRLTGFSPKWMARIIRLQQVLEILTMNDNISLAELALQKGYFDQAHFSKEFKAFTGQSPSEYRLQLMLRRSEPPPNLVQFLQDPIRDLA